ncbi:MAG: Gfo/Idh/MocA family oxidoreductase [bacterium]
MMENVRIGIVGLGGIAQLVHIPILSKIPVVTIVAASETNKEKLRTVSDKFGIKNRYTNYREMLEMTELDAVIIATPTDTHKEIAIECIKAGKDIFIEKPAARSYEEVKDIYDISRKHSVKVLVGMNARFRPDAMLLKSLITSNELGELYYIRCGWTKKMSSSQKWFMSKAKSGGGVIIDLGIVMLDLACWLFDHPPVKTISVQSYAHAAKGVEDSAIGMIRLKNSCVLNFEFSWSLRAECESFYLSAFCKEGTALLNPLRAYKSLDLGQIDYTPARTGNSKDLDKKSYDNQMKHFIGAVRGNNPVFSSIEDSLEIAKLIEGIYESAGLNKEIAI